MRVHLFCATLAGGTYPRTGLGGRTGGFLASLPVAPACTGGTCPLARSNVVVQVVAAGRRRLSSRLIANCCVPSYLSLREQASEVKSVYCGKTPGIYTVCGKVICISLKWTSSGYDSSSPFKNECRSISLLRETNQLDGALVFRIWQWIVDAVLGDAGMQQFYELVSLYPLC